MPIPKVHGQLDRMLLLVALCALSCPVVAQVTTGTFLGTVHDNTSAAVAGASITVTNLQTGVARSVLSGDDGEYVINLLPVGNYSVRVEHTGFKTDEHASIELQINGHVRLDFVLRVGSVSEKIEVKGSAPLLDTDTAESGEVIENQRVTQLPLNGRQFIQLALLTAGVVPEVKGTLSSPLALSGQSANANGARFEDNVFLLDGVLIRDEVYERLTVSPRSMQLRNSRSTRATTRRNSAVTGVPKSTSRRNPAPTHCMARCMNSCGTTCWTPRTISMGRSSHRSVRINLA